MKSVTNENIMILKARDFVKEQVVPSIEEFERNAFIPKEFFIKMAKHGFLGLSIPKKYGGLELDYLTLGAIHEEFGKGYCSVQNILTVYAMVCKPLNRFGTEDQKQKWLPAIAKGETIVSIAITEPKAGSDIKQIETEAVLDGDDYVINGKKRYITLGQIADLFLVFGKCNGRGIAFLVERETPGFEIHPINGLLGLRANMLAELHLKNCRIPKENLIGRVGHGLSHVATFALDEGRYTTACGCVGLGQACLEEAFKYAEDRIQFNSPIREHQLVQKMLTEMIVNVKAARLLCHDAGMLRDAADPSSIAATLMAKYYASKMSVMVSNYAVQIHGASGCVAGAAVERFYRDSKVMEIIEGASQLYEIHIAKNFRI